MNIVMVTSAKAWGGIERKICILANELCRSGRQVHLFVIRDGKTPYPEELDDGVHVSQLGGGRWDWVIAGRIRKKLKFLSRTQIIFFKLRDARLYQMIKPHFAGISAVYDINSTLSKGLNGNARRLREVAAILKSVDQLVCVSNGVSAHIMESYNIEASKVSTIYNPLVRVDDVADGKTCQHPWLQNQKPEIPTFISAGRLVEAKDFPTLIRAFHIVRQSLNCRLIILGEGILRPHLERMVKDHGIEGCVSLPGYVSRPQSYFARSSLFILSSRNEGLGNVLVEALSAHTPVISTDCKHGPSEILEGGRLGALVPPGDPEVMAKAMINALTSDPPPTEFIEQSLERFNAVAITESYVSLLKKLSLPPENLTPRTWGPTDPGTTQ